MPLKKSYKRKTNKRKYSYKKKKNTVARPSVKYGITSLFPTHQTVGMKYVKTLGLVSASSKSIIGGNNEFSLNSIFKPDVTFDKDRPQGYDQIKDIYYRYKVLGAWVKITFSNPSQDGLYACVRVRSPYDADVMTGEDIGEARMKRWTKVMPINNTGKQYTTYLQKWNMPSMLGVDRLQFNSSVWNYAAVMTENPLFQPYLGVGLCNTMDDTDATIQCYIEITYQVQLLNRRIIPNSVVPSP